MIQVDPAVQRGGIVLYGGSGHNILEGGSGDNVLIGGSGTSILVGGGGDDALYGGVIYQNLINSLGNAPSVQGSGAPTANAEMTWLREQAPGHNYLIAGSGNSELYAGNGGDMMIGANAQFNAQTLQFVLTPGTGGRDVFEGGNGNDLMIGGLGGDAMTAGAGNDVLIGGNGENVLEGGGGSDVLVGGSLINVMMSSDNPGTTSYLLGGSGRNFEFGGAGSDQLFDYSNPSDPLQSSAWATINALATQFNVNITNLPLNSTIFPINPLQTVNADLSAQNYLNTIFTLLNSLIVDPTQYGYLTADNNMVSNLYFMQQTATTTWGSNIVSFSSAAPISQLIEGDVVTGPGIPAGTTITGLPSDYDSPLQPYEFSLSNPVTTDETQPVQLTFSDPIVVAPTWENGSVAAGSTSVTDLAELIGATGNTTAGSATIAQIASTATLAVGDTVTGSGIPQNTTIVQITDDHSIVLSQNATVDGTTTNLQFAVPLQVGQPVSGAGIPAGTTIAAVLSGTSVTMSNAATATGNPTIAFGSQPIDGPQVTVQPLSEYGVLTNGSTTVTGLQESLSVAGNSTAGSATITQIASTANLAVGDTVTGSGIQSGTIITQIYNNSIILSASATSTGTGTFSFSLPLQVGEPVTGFGIQPGTTIAAILGGTAVTLSNAANATGNTMLSFPSTDLPTGDNVASIISGNSVALYTAATQSATTLENGVLTTGSTTVTGLQESLSVAGNTTAGSAMITQLTSMSNLAAGDTVTGPGIQAGTIITQVYNNTILLSASATATGTGTALQISVPLQVGQPVSGAGIPAGTTIAAVVSGTSVTLSNAATATGPASLSFSPLVQLNFQLTPNENNQRLALNNLLDSILFKSTNALSQVGANAEVDFLQGGTEGTDSLYAGPDPVWMEGKSVNDTFNITPYNFSSFVYGSDTIDGYLPSSLQLTGTTTGGSKLVTGINTSQLYVGELVTGNGIPDGTSISFPTDSSGNPIPDEIQLSNEVNSNNGTNQTPLTFYSQTQLTATTVGGSNVVTGLQSTGQLFIGELVTGAGIQPGTTITGFPTDSSGNSVQGEILLSNPITTSGTNPVQLSFGRYSDALMFLGDGNFNLSYNNSNLTDRLTVSGPASSTMTWDDGGKVKGLSTVNYVDIVGVQTLGGDDSITVTGDPDSKKFGNNTWTILVVDGGTTAQHGSVTVDMSGYLGQASLQGGLGNDTFKIDWLAYGSLVQGKGDNQYNELDILADDGGAQIIDGPEVFPGGGVQENLQDNGVWIGGYYFKKLVVVGGTGSNTIQSDGQISDVILEGGSGTNLLTSDVPPNAPGAVTLIGGIGTNTLNANGGIVTLIGGQGQNTFNLSGSGTYNIVGGSGANLINVSSGTTEIVGGLGVNTFNLSGGFNYIKGGLGDNVFTASGGDDSIYGGLGPNVYNLTGTGYYSVTGGGLSNQLNVQLFDRSQRVNLEQYGSAIYIYGYNETNFSALFLGQPRTCRASQSMAVKQETIV